MTESWTHMTDFTMKRILVSCGLLIFVCVTLPFLWLVTVVSRGQQEMNEDDETLHRMVRSLHSAQDKLEQYEQEMSLERGRVIQSYFPWMVQKNNTLPNFFSMGAPGMDLNERDYDGKEIYRRSVKVFLQSHGKESLKPMECIQSELTSGKIAKSVLVNAKQNYDLLAKSSDKAGMYLTSFSLGVCNRIKKSCSNFVIVQDPLERALQSYTHCKTMPRDLLCSAVNADQVSLRQWILMQGSLLFQQLIYTPEQCKNVFVESLESSAIMDTLSSFDMDFSHLITRDLNRLPCWFRHKLKLFEMPESVLESTVEYIVNNLDHWFSVVGMDIDMDSSLKMFEHVYGLNFSECGKIKSVTPDIYADKNSAREFIHVSENNRANRNMFRESDFYDDNNLEYLKSDPYVTKALELDYKIYRRLRSIFRIQKQVLLNELK